MMGRLAERSRLRRTSGTSNHAPGELDGHEDAGVSSPSDVMSLEAEASLVG